MNAQVLVLRPQLLQQFLFGLANTTARQPATHTRSLRAKTAGSISPQRETANHRMPT
jgi:hypothetical protein